MAEASVEIVMEILFFRLRTILQQSLEAMLSFPRGLKAKIILPPLAYGLKPVPLKPLLSRLARRSAKKFLGRRRT